MGAEPVDTGPVTTANLDIVPPRRLGMLLAGVRDDCGLTLLEASERTGMDEHRLASIEAGDAPLDGESVEQILAGYGTTLDELLPARRQVVLDLASGRLLVAEEVTRFEGSPSAEEVLAAYLSLVYSLRHATPGSPVVLRGYDVAVLARALDLAEPEVEHRLTDLMLEPSDEVSRLTKLLHSKLVVPMAGAVIVATALGTVLVLRSDDRPTPAPTSVQRMGDVPPPSVGPAATAVRNEDGTVSSAVETTP
jgi:transcriptional regulator with XRE-family HTH domain